jgi:hypothetical protein
VVVGGRISGFVIGLVVGMLDSLLDSLWESFDCCICASGSLLFAVVSKMNWLY